MSEPSRKIRVAICGGGISGLCLGVALSRYSHIKVDVYEAAGQFKEIGAGVMIWARTWRILELMGLAEDFAKVAHAPPDGSMGVGFDYRRSDAPKEGFRFRLVQMPYGCIRFHRASFLDAFVNHLPPDLAHFGKRLLSYAYPSNNTTRGAQLYFADGSTSECDILIGCDGIKSTIRTQMYENRAGETNDSSLLSYIKPLWTGTIAYRGLVGVENLKKMGGEDHRAIENPMMYCGKRRHAVSYSISQGNIVNVVTFVSEPEKNGSYYPDDDWVTECPQQELLDAYKNWEPEVERLLKCIERPTRWAIHHLKPLPFYVSNRVALLGDAAHAMAPHQGAGAGQAIEDAYILACLLGKATIDTVEQALLAYEKVRLPAANAVLQGSFESGKMYEFDSVHGEEYAVLGPAIQAQWNWISATTVEQDVGDAIEYFMRIAPRSRM
ncbi:FAD/NAD(P)-binding domain-containing protein [Macrolepiota fuliginosa MF-IS2]|uniref:FAD/NAD(P)-binding domain-containing protein n=1 Tax=Macrolepiota fuliginosa MF-IS2 TaxID=1400762 RepID=A0A9P6C6G4_9AGAR|nr:FAD/NAD(P)-binding domain-containing protein [Macrolepiota fuliginosa MF-IS2]